MEIKVSVSHGGLIQSSGSSSTLTLASGKMQILVVVGLQSPIPCWLSTAGPSQLLEATCFPLHLHTSTVCPDLCMLHIFLLSHLLPAGEHALLFKGHVYSDWAAGSTSYLKLTELDSNYICNIPSQKHRDPCLNSQTMGL